MRTSLLTNHPLSITNRGLQETFLITTNMTIVLMLITKDYLMLNILPILRKERASFFLRHAVREL